MIPKKNMKSNTGLRGDQKRQCKPRTEQSQLGHLRRRDCSRVYPTHTLFLRLRGGGTFFFDEKIIFFLRRRDRPRVYPTHTLFLRLRGGGTFIFLTTCHVHVVTN